MCSFIPSPQSLWRQRTTVKLYKPLLHRIKLAKERKRVNAAVMIQSRWRGFVQYSTYLIRRYENKAATTIQAHWRGYLQSTSYSVLYWEISVENDVWLHSFANHFTVSHNILPCSIL